MLEGYVITDGERYVDGVRRDGTVVWISAETQARERDAWNSWEAANDFITTYSLEHVRIKKVLGDENGWVI